MGTFVIMRDYTSSVSLFCPSSPNSLFQGKGNLVSPSQRISPAGKRQSRGIGGGKLVCLAYRGATRPVLDPGDGVIAALGRSHARSAWLPARKPYVDEACCCFEVFLEGLRAKMVFWTLPFHGVVMGYKIKNVSPGARDLTKLSPSVKGGRLPRTQQGLRCPD